MAMLPTYSEVFAASRRFNGVQYDNNENGKAEVEFPSMGRVISFRDNFHGWDMDIKDGNRVGSLFDPVVISVRVQEFNYFSHDVIAEIRNRLNDYETEGVEFDTSHVGGQNDSAIIYAVKGPHTQKFKITVTALDN